MPPGAAGLHPDDEAMNEPVTNEPVMNDEVMTGAAK
jgi:hypothetical protein